MADQGRQETGIFGKLGASVKKAATDKMAAMEEERRQHAEREQAAGALVTSGVFGSSTIEIYRAGYVRVAGPSESSVPSRIDKKTPYERLLSISFTASEQQTTTATAPAPWEGAATQAVAAVLKGGAGILKASGPGLVATGVAQVAKSMSGKSSLVIATDKGIHTLTNQVKNDFGIPFVKKEHEGVARTLEQVGNDVLRTLGVQPTEPVAGQMVDVATQPNAASQPAVTAPSLSERLRELAKLHAEGILDDAEFAAAKAKLLGNL